MARRRGAASRDDDDDDGDAAAHVSRAHISAAAHVHMHTARLVYVYEGRFCNLRWWETGSDALVIFKCDANVAGIFALFMRDAPKTRGVHRILINARYSCIRKYRRMYR